MNAAYGANGPCLPREAISRRPAVPTSFGFVSLASESSKRLVTDLLRQTDSSAPCQDRYGE